MEELLARVRALIRRAAGHASVEIRCGQVILDTRSGRVSLDGRTLTLTSLELRVLAYLMHHREKVVSSVPWTPGTRLAALLLGDIVLRVGRGASFASLPTLWGL